MARGTNGKNAGKATKSSRPERAPFVGYVNVTLTEADKDDFVAWCAESDLTAECYLDSLERGYQYTIKFDEASDGYSCSVSRWLETAPDAGIIYTGRSDNVEVSRLKAVYVLTRKLDGNLANGYVKRQYQDAF